MQIFLAIVIACMALGANAVDKRTDPGYFFNMDERLGHFANEPFTDLYKAYAVAFVRPKTDLEGDNMRNFAPSGEECMTYLTEFRMNDYVVEDLDKFIVLDACLGYIFESENHEYDSSKSAHVASNLPVFQQDPKLKEIYNETAIDKFKHEAKVCIGTLLLDVVRVKQQFSDMTCNNHWIQVFNNFGACHNSIDEDLRLDDSYLKILYELLKRRGVECFHAEIHHMNVAIRDKYLTNSFHDFFYKHSRDSLKNQQHDRYWPKQIKTLLSAVQGTKKEIILRQVANILRGITVKHPNFTRTFLRNIATFANEYMKPKENSKEHKADPQGIERYRSMIDNVCEFFRDTNYPGYYNYAKALVRMVTMLKYPEIYGITTKYFITQVLTKSWESGAVYLATSSCNILSFTVGMFSKSNSNSQLEYKVDFVPNTSGMILWPDAGYY